MASTLPYTYLRTLSGLAIISYLYLKHKISAPSQIAHHLRHRDHSPTTEALVAILTDYERNSILNGHARAEEFIDHSSDFAILVITQPPSPYGHHRPKQLSDGISSSFVITFSASKSTYIPVFFLGFQKATMSLYRRSGDLFSIRGRMQDTLGSQQTGVRLWQSYGSSTVRLKVSTTLFHLVMLSTSPKRYGPSRLIIVQP